MLKANRLLKNWYGFLGGLRKEERSLSQMSRAGTLNMLLLICFSVALLSVLLFQGCLLDVTSVVGPNSTSTGKVITLTVNAKATSDGKNHYGGLILQIPNGTSVLRVSYSGSASGIMIENTSITAGYVPESGYHLYGASSSSSHDGDGSVMTFKVWLSVPSGVIPGTYTVKAAVGGNTESGVWVPQNPQATGSPVLNFSLISGNYASNPITISTGTSDSVAPANVTPTVSGDYISFIAVTNSSYDEATQGDVAKYRVYLSKTLFSTTAGRQFLDNTTVPNVTGTSSNIATFSTDIGTGLSYFEIPPGSEYSLGIFGLSLSAYYFAVTAVDLSGNESNPVVVRLAERSSLTVTKSGTGTGTGTVTATGCTLSWSGNTGTCTVSSGTSITLSGTADASSTWNGWSGGTGSASSCSGTGDCTFSITTTSGVTATFTSTSCTYTISPTSQSFTSSSGTGSVTVTASSSSCTWTATESLDWVSITSGSSGTGSGTVSYTVSANTTGATRTGSMTIAGQTFTITQTAVAGIVQTITPPTTTTVSQGGTLGPFSVTTTNNGASSYSFYAYPYIRTPDGTWHLIFSNYVTMAAGATNTISGVYIGVPATAQAGTHYYQINLYDTSGNLIDYDGFSFSVTTATSSDSPGYLNDVKKAQEIMSLPGAEVIENDGWKMIIVRGE